MHSTENMNSFLEREKELMKLNEELNQKCAVTLAARTKPTKTTKKSMATATTTTTKPTKIGKSKSDASKSNALAVTQDPIVNQHHEPVNGNEDNTIQPERDTSSTVENVNQKNETQIDRRDPIERFLHGFTVESKLKMTDDLPDVKCEIGAANENTKPANGLNLIPNNNMMRRNVSTDGIIKFLKAKVTILQQELDLSHKDNAKHLEQLDRFSEQQKKLEMARDQLGNKLNATKSQVEKLQQQIADDESNAKEKDVEMNSLRKECADLKSKLKQTIQSNNAYDTRLFKSQQDLECVRKNYLAVKVAEKEVQQTLQHERKFYENRLKVERKEYNDLIAAYKKQMLLIDNLKRQQTLLEQSKLVQMAEQDFLRCLDWPNNDRANGVETMTMATMKKQKSFSN